MSKVINEISRGITVRKHPEMQKLEPRKLPNTKKELDSVCVVYEGEKTAKDFKYGIYLLQS
jgi:hypothetical protein